MYKILILSMIAVACTITLCAQKLKETQIPSAIRYAFKKKYPNTPARWEKENNNFEANFKKDGKIMSALINKAGTILETETDIAVDELPKAAQSYLKVHYKVAKIKEAAKIVKAKGEVNYEGEVNGKDVIFDTNGKFIKEAKD